MSRYRNQGIEFLSTNESEDGRTSTVRTRILEKGSPPIAVDYNLRKTEDSWKIYDVRIEGISLVLSFRTTFAEQIRNGDLDGLIEQLAARNAAAGIDDAFVRKALDAL